MTIPCSLQQREYEKFFETPEGETGVRTGGNGSIIAGLVFDEIQATYPNTTTEVYEYKLASATVATVTVTYVDNTKCEIVSVVRS